VAGPVGNSYVGNRSRDLLNKRAAWAATSTWFPTVPCSPRATPATANANNYRPLQGYGNRGPSHQQPVRQLQRAAGQLDTPCRQVHHSEPTTHGRSPWVSFRRPSTRSASVRTTAPRPRIAETCSTQPTRLTREPWFHSNAPGGRGRQRMAALRHYAVGERRQPHLRRQISNQTPNLNYNFLYLRGERRLRKQAAGISCPQSAAIIPGSISTANPKGIAINNQSILGTVTRR
jgi:hypothetical protein